MRDKLGRYVKGTYEGEIRWDKNGIYEELARIYAEYGCVKQKFLVIEHNSACINAMRRIWGSYQDGLAALGFPVIKIYRVSQCLIPPINPILTPEKAALLGWITETSIYQNNHGSWLIQLESPEKELHEIFRKDFRQVYSYWGKNWGEFKLTGRKTYKSRVCYQEIIEDIYNFASWGTFNWGLKQNYFNHASHNSYADAAFLRRVFDCEGSVSNDKGCIHIPMTSANWPGSTLISNLLSSLGIENTTIPDIRATGRYLIVRVNKKEAVRKFAKIVNFSLSRKRDKLAYFISQYKS